MISLWIVLSISIICQFFINIYTFIVLTDLMEKVHIDYENVTFKYFLLRYTNLLKEKPRGKK